MPEPVLDLVQTSALLVNTVPNFVFFFPEPLADSYGLFLVETMVYYSIFSTGNQRKTCEILTKDILKFVKKKNILFTTDLVTSHEIKVNWVAKAIILLDTQG